MPAALRYQSRPADVTFWRKWTVRTNVERAGHAADPEARVCGVRQAEVCETGGDLGRAPVQLAPQRGIPEGDAVFESTRPSVILDIRWSSVADPRGEPGYLRVDTVHQGDWGGERRLSHQRGGHGHTVAGDRMPPKSASGSDSGAGSIISSPFAFRASTPTTARSSSITRSPLLEKLLVEFTVARLPESGQCVWWKARTGAVIRKLIGYGHIPSQHAEAVQKFYGAHESLLELSSTLRICDRQRGCARQAATALQAKRLCHAIRKTQIADPGGAYLKPAWHSPNWTRQPTE